MFRTILDAMLDYKLVHVVGVAVQFGVLIWALWFRGGLTPVLAVNLVISGIVGLYNAPHVPAAFGYGDWPLIGLVAFELVIFAVSAGALWGIRIAPWLVWLGFVVNFCLCMALMLFILTFRMTRLM